MGIADRICEGCEVSDASEFAYAQCNIQYNRFKTLSLRSQRVNCALTDRLVILLLLLFWYSSLRVDFAVK